MLIEQLQQKGGEAYSETGKRNPIRRDTNHLLTALVLARDPRVILEVGTAYGVSALCMGLGMKEGSRLISYEFDEDVAAEAQAYLTEAGVNATVVAGAFPKSFDPAVLEDELIDFVFLDGEKSGYLRDFKAIELYLSAGAVILADNVTDRQTECQDFLDYIDDRYKMVIIPTECGLLVAS